MTTTLDRKNKAAEARELERQTRETNEAKQYLPLLMTALEAATSFSNFELTVRSGQFVLVDCDSDSSRTYLSPVYTSSNWNELADLQYVLKKKAEHRAAIQRQLDLKKAALAKLSEEERMALGI